MLVNSKKIKRIIQEAPQKMQGFFYELNY